MHETLFSPVALYDEILEALAFKTQSEICPCFM